MQGQIFAQLLKFIGFSYKISLTVYFYQHSYSAVMTVTANKTAASLTFASFYRFGKTFLLHLLQSFVKVTTRVNQRLFGISHPYSGHFSKLLDVFYIHMYKFTVFSL